MRITQQVAFDDADLAPLEAVVNAAYQAGLSATKVSAPTQQLKDIRRVATGLLTESFVFGGGVRGEGGTGHGTQDSQARTEIR